MIFAAGLGTRLQPLTNNCPKALVEVAGKPLLQHCIEKLKAVGVREIIVNVHHFAEMVEDFLRANNFFGLRIEISDERESLLDTGGGLKKTAWFFDDEQPFILHNVDIFSTIDLHDLYQFHLQSNALVTLACNNRTSARYFLFDNEQRLCGWENVTTQERTIAIETSEALKKLAFGGIHVINPKFFRYMPSDERFSIVNLYLQIAPQALIKAYTHENLQFLDVGKPQQLAEAANFLKL